MVEKIMGKFSKSCGKVWLQSGINLLICMFLDLPEGMDYILDTSEVNCLLITTIF